MAESEVRPNENDHDLLIRIDTKLGILLTQFHEHKDQAVREITILKENKVNKEDFINLKKEQDTQSADHEDRIRRLERYGSIAIGAIAVIQILIGFIK